MFQEYGVLGKSLLKCLPSEKVRQVGCFSSVAPDGLVLDIVSVLYTPRDIPGVRSRTSCFTARLPYTLGEDITLRITHHDNLEVAASPTNDRDKFLYEQNMTSFDEG